MEILGSTVLWAAFAGHGGQEASSSLAGSQAKAGDKVGFARDIQPIFEASCYRCHGPGTQMAQLRLDSKTSALQGGLSGKAIVPGRSQESLLFQRVLGQGEKVRMPFQGDPLPPEQIALIRAWIDQGGRMV